MVAVYEASQATGLTLEQLLAVPGAEQMTRIQNGGQEQAVRIPVEVLEAAALDRDAVIKALADYADGGSDAELRAQVREIVDAEERSS